MIGLGHTYLAHAADSSFPNEKDTTAELPENLKGSVESVLDFDNDGKVDRVFLKGFDTNYMQGSVLLVQPGGGPVVEPASNPKAFLVPCQMDSRRFAISACPPFSQEGDESGVFMGGGPGRPSIFFRARYSEVEPFFFKGTTFVDVRSDFEDFVGVLKPLPGRRFRQVCLLRHVPENF